MKIIFDSTKHTYDAGMFIFHMSERDVPFATTYDIINPKTGKEMRFEFTHSTGAEFDPKTIWVYKNADKSVSLFVHNDPKITRVLAANYLKAKLNG
jgi:hypothetical protein